MPHTNRSPLSLNQNNVLLPALRPIPSYFAHTAHPLRFSARWQHPSNSLPDASITQSPCLLSATPFSVAVPVPESRGSVVLRMHTFGRIHALSGLLSDLVYLAKIPRALQVGHESGSEACHRHRAYCSRLIGGSQCHSTALRPMVACSASECRAHTDSRPD